MVLSCLGFKLNSQLSKRQIFCRIDRFAETAHFKMKLYLAGIGLAHECDFLSARDALPFLHQYLVVMRISTEVGIVVLDDDQLAITAQTAAAIDHLAGRAGHDRLSLIHIS